MDPLSIAVAVVGLLGSAEAVRRKLSQFTRSATSAPSIAETVLIEVSSIETALPRLRRFIEDDRVSTREHIYLDQLSTLLTGCVKRFSELETLLGGLPSITAAETSRIDAARWAQNEKRIRIVVERLQPYKSSLLLMLQIIELQSIRDHSLVLARMQTSIEQLKDRMLSGDPDLAMRISKATVFAATEDIGSRPFASRTDSDSSVASSSMPASSPTSPLSPTRELHSAFDAERRQRGWRASFRSKQARADDLMQRVTNRPESVKTSSSTSSAATMMSSSSTSSKASLATVDNISVYRLPISAEDVSNGHHYIGVALEPTVSPPVVLDDTALLKKVVEAEDEDEAAETVSALPPSAQHRKVLPIMSRPSSRAESRMDSKQTLVTSRASKAAPAEIEMSARKYQGYWRASFDAALPAVAAICGCVLLTTGAGTSGPQKYTRTDDVVDCAEAYAEALAQAPSPAQLLRAVQAGDAEDLVFALKASLDASPPPVVPAKIAFSMYKELAEAKDKQKMTKAWDKISKLLKKVPQEALVPLMFFATIGRKLRQRGMIVEGKPAGVYLMQNLWPQLGSKSLFANDTAAGDAVSHLLITQYDDIPDELPVMLQAVNYKFESGSKVNLMTLLTTKRVRQGMHGREGSSGTSAS